MLTHEEWLTFASLLEKLGDGCHAASDGNGFWLYPTPSEGPIGQMPHGETLEIAAKIGLIANECGELLEAWRLADPFGPCPKDPVRLTHMSEEMADVVIRLLDLSSHYRIDLGAAIAAKLAVNAKRPYKHSKRF
jgi:NTP pyrophosphatase (non-canonical NTP hydrolase)